MSASTLLRSKWLILGVFLLVSAAALPPIWLFTAPTYDATATVRVAPVIPRLVFNTEENRIGPFYRSYMNTQVSNISNPTALQRVLDREDVKATKWYHEEPRTLRTLLGSGAPNHLERLKTALTVEPRRNTELIDVRMTTSKPADGQTIVNAVVDEYLGYCNEQADEQEKLVFNTLRKERKVLDQQIEGLVESMGNLSKQLGTDDPDIVRSQLATQVGELEMNRNNLDRTYKLTVWELETRRSGEQEKDGNGDEAGVEDPNLRYAGDSQWVGLMNALETARLQLKMADHHYGESHPRIKELQAGMEHAERLLRQREAQLGPGWQVPSDPESRPVDDAVIFFDEATLVRLAQKQKRELELLDQQIEELKRDQQYKGELAKGVAKIDDQRRRKHEVYEAVHARLQALEMEQKAPGRISVAARAAVPSQPRRDRRFLLSVMALGGGMMMGLVAAYLRNTNPKIHEASDVRYAVQVPFLGQLPPLPLTADLTTGCSPLVVEGIRMVRTALLERVRGTNHRAVLVTSSSSQAGKSTVVALLARSLAALGKKVLLVEADLRRPSLAERLGIQAEVGLTAVLTGRADDRQAIQATGTPGLNVLLAGERPADFDSEFLANGVFAASLARWKKSYDFVLMDSPPVLPVADARILASHADGIIMVLRSSHCRRTEVVQSYADLIAAGSTLLGTVLVGDRSSPRYQYYYRHSSLYGAGGDGSRALEA